MHMIIHPIRFMIVGGLLALFGAAVSFAMVIRVVEATFFLSFLVYISSVIGVFLGIIGAVEYNGRQNWRN